MTLNDILWLAIASAWRKLMVKSEKFIISIFSLLFVFHSELFELKTDCEALTSEVSIMSCLGNTSSV